jgi:predicted  nucleic acid-binding Zn-ribbon protein
MPLVRRPGSRALCTGLLVLSITAIAVLLAPLARAQTTTPAASENASTLRAEADAASGRYFAALDRVQALDSDIARNQQVVEAMLARAKQARANARARALIAYTSSGTQLSTLVDGSDTIDTARRAQLIDSVNQRDETVYAKLRDATRALHQQQRVLRDTRAAQEDALAQLRDEGAAIDAKLAQAVQHEQQAQAAVAALAAAPATAAPATSGGAAPAAAPSTSGTTGTTAITAPPAPAAPTPPPSYSGTPGASPHHDDPFLSCVRNRESGGNYGAVNPAGPYLGAYQFLQATWNVSASHAGRSDLVGVPANVASAYDQDEIAWTLYQWQGSGPWGGGC